MTQDEIIEMYLEVSNKLCNGTEWCWAGVGEPLQLFAKLIAQHEREAKRREWVNLTDDEIKEIVGSWGDTPVKGYTRKLMDQIQDKLKEKNG